jgi:hypothetical protein
MANNPYSQPQKSETYSPNAPQGSTTKIVLIVVAAVAAFCLLICVGFAALLLPAVQSARQAAQGAMATNNLREAIMGMHDHEFRNGCFPARFTRLSDGTPAFSWRVPLAEELLGPIPFDQTSTWDDPFNMGLAQQMPEMFRHPNAPATQAATESNVFAIDDSSSMMNEPPVAKSQCVDGLSNTVMVVMLPNASVLWTKPEDLTPDEAYSYIERLQPPQTAILGMADGSCIRVHAKQFSKEDFRAMCTRDGGERISW